MPVSVCVHTTRRGQRKALDNLEFELQANITVMWVLGPEPVPSVLTVSTLTL